MTPKRLLILALLVATVWSIYWGVVAIAAKQNLTAWFESRRADGWQAEASDISVAGFPNRIDRTITDLVVADPQGGWVWRAPFFQILGLSYDRAKMILIWPQEQRFDTPTQKFTVTGESLRASVSLDSSNRIETLTGVLEALRISSDSDWAVDASEVRVAVRPTAGRSGWMDVGAEAIGLRPPAPFVATLSESGELPNRFDRVYGDFAVRFDTEAGLSGWLDGSGQIDTIDIDQVVLEWGALELSLSGELTADRDGRAEGEIDVTARNWNDILSVAGEAGLLTEAAVQLLGQGLNLLSGFNGSRETLDIPLSFRDGDTYLGPIRVAPAPMLRP